MTGLVNLVAEAVAFVLLAKTGAVLVGYTTWRERRLPAGAVALLALVSVPSIAQLIWPSILHALDRQPAAIVHHGQLWRVVTAAFVQDGAISGIVFNLVSLGVIAALAEWHWGARRMGAIFVVAAVLLNVQAVAFGLGGAGSSGATYALGASLAGALILTGTSPQRLRAIACPLLGAAMLVLGDAHGLAILYGTLAGLALQVAARRSSRAWGSPARARPRLLF